MKLSVLDVLPVISGADAGQALRQAGELAQAAEQMGFERLWYAEHHGMRSIASATPEILIAHAASQTARIRLGAGGVMLPNHVPLRVVEQYRTLNALYPGRVDLGVGRAAGTDPLNAKALRSTPGQMFPRELEELLAFERGGFPHGHPFGTLSVTPGGVPLPPMWMLGSSGGSSALAGQLGMGYGFAGHFSPTPAAPAIEQYRAHFRPSPWFEAPYVILAMTVVCAETEAEATELSSSMEMQFLDLHRGKSNAIRSPEEARMAGWHPSLRMALGPMGQLMIVGTPDQVAAQIEARIEEAGGVDEVMVMTITHDAEARLRSYKLLAQRLG